SAIAEAAHDLAVGVGELLAAGLRRLHLRGTLRTPDHRRILAFAARPHDAAVDDRQPAADENGAGHEANDLLPAAAPRLVLVLRLVLGVALVEGAVLGMCVAVGRPERSLERRLAVMVRAPLVLAAIAVAVV